MIDEEEKRPEILIFGLVILATFTILLLRLWMLQVIAGTELKKLAEGNRVRAIEVESPRGAVFDRNNKLLTGNKPSITVTIEPKQSKDKKTIGLLSQILNIEKNEILDNLKKQDKKLPALAPRTIATDLDIETATKIQERKAILPGVEIKNRSVRFYPNGELAAHVLGYVGEISPDEISEVSEAAYSISDIIGKMGIEKSYENILRGQKGGKQIEVDSAGRPKRILSKREPVPGHSINLTLDLDIQDIAESSLAKYIKLARKSGAGKARAGAAVILDPNNGEVIALASYPTFDPSQFVGGIKPSQWKELNEKKNFYPLHNRATMAAYPPGSTFKIITALAGYQDSIINSRTTFLCTGKWTAMGSKWPKFCWKRSGHGRSDIIRALTISCDTYFYEIGYRLFKKGSEAIQRVSYDFGFGNKTGIDLPWEAAGRVPDAKWKKEWNKNNPANRIWLPGDNVNLSIGQGDMLATPLQVANAFAAIANEGTLYRPHLLKKVESSDRATVYTSKKEPLKDNLGSTFTNYIETGLKGAVQSGTAKQAFAGFPVKIAGKTGTSQVYGKDDLAWFVGYGPLPRPEYVVAVVIEEGGSGGSVAAPAVREIFGRIMDLPKESYETKEFKDYSR